METFGFQLALFSDDGKLTTLQLPQEPDGFYRFGEADAYRFISVEAQDGRWIAICSRPAYFKDVPLDQYQRVPLQDGQLLQIEHQDRFYMLYCQQLSKEATQFTAYQIQTGVEVFIGSSADSDLRCDSPFISPHHAVLTRSHSKWQIRDCGSTNGVYVNGLRVNTQILRMGDAVYIMGLRLLIGSDFISINSPNGRVSLSQRVQKPATTHHGTYGRYSGEDAPREQELYFNRPPRQQQLLQERIITVEGPPVSMDRAQMPMLLRMGGSMVMGGKAALAGNFTTLITSVLFPFMSQKFTEKQRQEYEQRRNLKYGEYLTEKRKEIDRACLEEKELLNRKYPELDEVIGLANQKIRLWERRKRDPDFMSLRLGSGQQPMSAIIDYPAQRFDLESDPLEERMYQLAESKYILNPVPIMNNFTQEHVCGLLGQRQTVLELVRQLILQTAISHSYDEVKLILLASPQELAQLDFVRYLPHCWDDNKSVRFIATNEAEAYQLGEYLNSQLPDDLEKERDLGESLKNRPFYMIFGLDKKLVDSIEYLKSILALEKCHGVALVAAYDDLPKECVRIFDLKIQGDHSMIPLRPGEGEPIPFKMDYCATAPALQNMKLQANLSLKADAQTYELPKMMTFLEMFRAGRVEHLNPLKRWRESNPVKSLAAPVGVATDGTLFTLDLHEKRQGPHGLVAGMTGSGKSEFIITYILSMAVTYHPDEVAFILIDYKGGGLAGAFENPLTGLKLPHLVGTITNLDGAAIQRSLMSIESELMRRQHVFNETKRQLNEGTMDIYAYQKLYRAGKVSEPMPHLFIISDEFAELKKQQPEFMDKLISAARIGRSLGVHLILATQKPGGVVNDQIRSNTKFRVCLRVQDRMDSMEMLKRPEAAELTDTGRFYLQVGYNEFFALGQSAWCGAAYEPRDTVVTQRDDTIEFLDTTGQILTKAKPPVKKTDSGMKQIMAVVQYLSDLAQRQGYQSRSLWKEPLPQKMSVAELQSRYSVPRELPVRALVGIADDPQRQDQYPLIMNLESCKHYMLVGETGNGKTTLLQTLLYSLVQNYSPSQLNYCILDFSNKRLSSFRRMPHCGGYLTQEDEDSLERFFEMLYEEIARRKKLLAQADVSSFDSYPDRSAMPLLLVVVHQLAGLTGSKMGPRLNWSELLRECAAYGIKFVISANFINEANSKLKQEIGSRLALHSKDRFTYGEILGQKVTYLPADRPGRGLCVIEGRPLEFHGAVAPSGSELRSSLEQLAKSYPGQAPVVSLPMLDETQTYQQFCQGVKPGRIPLGYSIQTVKPVMLPFKQLYCLSLHFGNPLGIRPVLDNLLSICAAQGIELILMRKTHNSVFGSIENRPITFLDTDESGCIALKERLIQEATQRKQIRNQLCRQKGIDENLPNAMELVADGMRLQTRPLLVVFESFRELCKNAPQDCKVIFQQVFSKGRGSNYYFIGCFEPDDAASIGMDAVMKSFNDEQLVMLFGGCLDRHGLVTLPLAYKNMTDVSERYNRCLMHYRGKFSQIHMPCGELRKADEDEDSAPIF